MTEVALTIKSCYLAGPMRGIEEYNFPAFHKAAKWLRSKGWEVFSPAERDEADPTIDHETDPAGWAGSVGFDYFMSFDLPAVCNMSAVVCLPGWEESTGARLETMVAVAVEHPVFEIVKTGKFGRGRKLAFVNPEYIKVIFAEKSLGVLEWKADEVNAVVEDAPTFKGVSRCTCEEECCGGENLPYDEFCGKQLDTPITQDGEFDPKVPAFENRNDDVVDAGRCDDPWCCPPSIDPGVGIISDLSVEGDALKVEGADGAMRVFGTGATRNVEVDPDHHGFMSPLATYAYGEYMHRHRLQADGTLRDSDNWQKGIPDSSFVRSLRRHVQDVELIHDGYHELSRHDDRDPDGLVAHLSAIIFNAQGMLHFHMLKTLQGQRLAGLHDETTVRRTVQLNEDGTPDAPDMFRVDEVMQIVGTVVGAVIKDTDVFPTDTVLQAIERGLVAVKADRDNREMEEEVVGYA